MIGGLLFSSLLSGCNIIPNPLQADSWQPGNLTEERCLAKGSRLSFASVPIGEAIDISHRIDGDSDHASYIDTKKSYTYVRPELDTTFARVSYRSAAIPAGATNIEAALIRNYRIAQFPYQDRKHDMVIIFFTYLYHEVNGVAVPLSNAPSIDCLVVDVRIE